MSDNYKFFQNKECEYFPCHGINDIEEFNCLFCYCPLYALGKKCGGKFRILDNGIKSCVECNIPHIKNNFDMINSRFKDISDLIADKGEL